MTELPLSAQIFTALTVLVAIISLLLGFWVYAANRKEKSNQCFAFMAIFILFWIIFYFLTQSSRQPTPALFWAKLAYGSVSIFYITFYSFFIYFLDFEKKFRILNKIIWSTSIILFGLSVFTDFVVQDIKFKRWEVDIIFGGVAPFFYGVAGFLSILVVYLLIAKYFKSSHRERLRIQYFLSGVLVWVVMNFIFNIILGLWKKSIKYSYFGHYSAIFLLGFTAYAIVKQELFGIKVILTQALVGVIAILLLWQAVIAIPNWLEFSWKFVLFLIFLYFGYLLVKSVIQEIKRRAELQRLYDELEKLDEAKTEFMSIVSHQLRTPLTAIKGYVSMILEGLYGNFAEKMKKPLDNVFASNERLIKFVNDILNVTRIETGRLEFIPEKTSMEEVISSVISELEIKSKEKNLYLRWEKPTPSTDSGQAEPLPKIFIDPDKIRQVVLNLIDNAIKYTKEGGVTVKLQIANGKLQIAVSDTGAGMSQEDIQKLFRSFSRGESGVTYYKEGTGLGLYIARQFVELQGGKVWAESEGKGKGSTFYIELPIK